MIRKVPMTVIGAERLRKELERLKRKERPAIIADIAEARAHGDLRENAEYHAAKEKQSFTEGRIADIESKLSHAQIIDISKMSPSEKVIFGATVKLIKLQSDEENTYQIVGEDEASIKDNKISVSSPLARAIIGKFSGDAVDVKTPSGVIEYEIADVEYL